MRKTLMIAAAACMALTLGTAQAAEPAATAPAAPAAKAPAPKSAAPKAAPKVSSKVPAGIQIKDVTEPPATVYKILADAKGMTLYTYANDKPGKSTCTGECAKFWPPLVPAADAKPAGDWTIITRDDGTKQWAISGKPVYTFLKDTRTWDFDGQNQPKDKPVWQFIMLEKKTADAAAAARK